MHQFYAFYRHKFQTETEDLVKRGYYQTGHFCTTLLPHQLYDAKHRAAKTYHEVKLHFPEYFYFQTFDALL